jgi:hypothetical protein
VKAVVIEWRCKSRWKYLPTGDLKWTRFGKSPANVVRAAVRRLNKGDSVFEYRIKPPKETVPLSPACLPHCDNDPY